MEGSGPAMTSEKGNDWHPARWVRITLPVLLLMLWVGAASVGGPTFGKLSSVSSNDQAAFLPASAESTEVNSWQQKFTDSQAIPAIAVIASQQGLSPEQLAAFAQLSPRFAAVQGVQAPVPPATSAILGPIPSQDGMAVQYIIPISDTNNVKTVVAELRSIAATADSSSVAAYVTGPAGLTADLVNAFGGIDGILLLVAAGAVFLILLLVYRSIVLPFLVLLTSIFALSAAILLVYAFANWGWIKLSGQSQGILSILVIGAATDYSLLLVARFRESLRHVESKWAAMGRAWRAALEPIAASGATVILALLCLLFSDLNSNRSLGPIAAIGIVFALLSALTLLPVLLVLFGRAAFWPFRPRLDSAHPPAHSAAAAPAHGLEDISGLWKRVGTLVSRRPRLTWAAALVVLVACGLGILQLQAGGVPQSEIILTQSQAVAGQKVSAEHFPSGSGSPVVIVAGQGRAEAVLAAAQGTQGISSASVYAGTGRPGADAQPVVREGRVLINAVLASEPDSQAAEQVVRTLRTTLPGADPGVLVGGVTAIALDTNTTAQSDLFRIIPIVLLVILLILMLLLRSIVAPVLLVASVVISYVAALGVSALVFNHVLHFPGADASVPLFGFVFLVALGVDYNIFLMTRVREESLRLGTRPGILRGLGMTGSVITSAGVVLAATFAALAVIPILFLAQIAFIVAFGVLLDTVVVRSLLVPAASYDMGRTIWWPSKLSHEPRNGEIP